MVSIFSSLTGTWLASTKSLSQILTQNRPSTFKYGSLKLGSFELIALRLEATSHPRNETLLTVFTPALLKSVSSCCSVTQQLSQADKLKITWYTKAQQETQPSLCVARAGQFVLCPGSGTGAQLGSTSPQAHGALGCTRRPQHSTSLCSAPRYLHPEPLQAACSQHQRWCFQARECCLLKNICIQTFPFRSCYVLIPRSNYGCNSPQVLPFERDPHVHWTKCCSKLACRHLAQRYLSSLLCRATRLHRTPEAGLQPSSGSSAVRVPWDQTSSFADCFPPYILLHHTKQWDKPEMKIYLNSVQTTTSCLSITVG